MTSMGSSGMVRSFVRFDVFTHFRIATQPGGRPADSHPPLLHNRHQRCAKIACLHSGDEFKAGSAESRSHAAIALKEHIPMTPPQTSELKAATPQPTLTADELRKMDAYWRACNYLCAGMIYLRDNPLLRKPLLPEHFKNRLLGHWGSDPGQSFVWVHLNRVIRKYDLDMIYISGPGHGAPAMISNCYLEGTYSEIYPEKSQDEAGMLRLFQAFSFPGQLGSHCTPEVPGSIHEGGELGYSISHAFGAAFDNPNLIVSVAVGDGEAETGPLATSWHSNKFLNPIRDGAVLPILHLNGYKIANPTILARIAQQELEALLIGYGHKPYFVEGEDPSAMHQKMASTLEQCILEIGSIQQHARTTGDATRPCWPMIVLRSPKGWTGPKEVHGHRI